MVLNCCSTESKKYPILLEIRIIPFKEHVSKLFGRETLLTSNNVHGALIFCGYMFAIETVSALIETKLYIGNPSRKRDICIVNERP